MNHIQLLIQAVTERAPKDTDIEFMNSQLRQLVQDIDMKECIAPRSVYVYNPSNAGITGQIGIETSHIAYHVWDEVHPHTLERIFTRNLGIPVGALWQMDIYTCGCLGVDSLSHVRQFLSPWGFKQIRYALIERAAGFQILSEGYYK